jgi:DNA-binding response OmpR family regulator
MKILLVEDDKNVVGFVEKGLEAEGFTVASVFDGKKGLESILTGTYDLVVLDLMIPQIDGLELLSKIREENIHIPVIVLTAKDAVADRVRGLNEGADDYLVKPFAFTELVARIHALMRRSSTHKEETETTLEIADLRMDLLKRRVKRGEKSIDLTPKEFILLEYLARNSGQPVTRAMIAEKVWNQHYNTFSNAIDVYVRYLRNKVDSGFANPLIHTVRGVGYMLSPEKP